MVFKALANFVDGFPKVPLQVTGPLWAPSLVAFNAGLVELAFPAWEPKLNSSLLTRVERK